MTAPDGFGTGGESADAPAPPAGGRWRFLRTLLRRSRHAAPSADAQVSPLTSIEHPQKLRLSRNVTIGPFNYIEASAGITLAEGVQIASHCTIVSCSSHRSQRLLGPGFRSWPVTETTRRPGWIEGPIHIGAYSFVGPHSLIEANSHIGRGSLVCAGSFVRGRYPDFAILEGRPARVVGDSRVADEKALKQFPDLRLLYESWTTADDELPGATR